MWTSFGLPQSMGVAGRSMMWVYNADRQRVHAVTALGSTPTAGNTTRRQDLVHPDARGGLFFEREETLVSGAVTQVENRHYITVAGGVVAVVKTLGQGNGTAPATGSGITRAVSDQTQYWHKDHLGSIVAVTNARGDLVERSAFDAWGRRMAATGAPDTGTLAAGNTMNAAHGDRGFTGHEMLDELGLVHMNGRIYDPVLGRFFSADPLIQAPEMLQSYNRYSYVMNMPLAGTDPDGQWWQIPALIIGAVLVAEGNQYWKMVGQIVMMAALNGLPGPGNTGLVEQGLLAAGGKAIGAVGNAFASGAIVGTYASGGDLGAGLQQGAFAAAFAFVGTDAGFGELTRLTPERLLAHALLGCAQGAASGGECGPSAAAAAFGKAATHGLEGMPGPAQFAGAVFIGGTASVIGGGKFANGAAQAAFGYLFNHAVSQNRQVGLTAQTNSVAAVRALGITPIENVAVLVVVNGKTVTAIADYAYRQGDIIVIGEVKAGPDAKFSVNQKQVYDAFLKGTAKFDASALGRLGLTPGMRYVPALEIMVDAGSRAARQATTRWVGRAFVGAVTVLGSAAASAATMLIEPRNGWDADPCKSGELCGR